MNMPYEEFDYEECLEGFPESANEIDSAAFLARDMLLMHATNDDIPIVARSACAASLVRGALYASKDPARSQDDIREIVQMAMEACQSTYEWGRKIL